ncbi:MAG: UDP-N-acetylmuramate--L-alanine ligase [Candidatus Pacebacteria bacterium]|nr:UDP-N-acetylmuramate--L-alanine ligase [Candidatus Paceibacterota bacterium]
MEKNTKEISNGVKIHFIGIGGIGVSALAQYYLSQGHKVSGSDLKSSEITKALKKRGAKVFIGPHKGSNLGYLPDLVIYSPAVKPDNPEFKKARKVKIKLQSYPQALGKLTKQHFTIAISGTHGKSTTTCMLGLVLMKAGFDPTIIVGTKMKEFKDSNCRVGKSKYLVIEADEHFASFLNYWPKIIVLTNIEKDHLDYYKNFGNILKAFRKYVSHLPKDGILLLNKDDESIKKISCSALKKYYSLKQTEAKKLKKILKVPGQHNVSNALAALTVARILKIPDKVSFKALSSYMGCWRRFEIKKMIIKKKPLTVVSDYGHHPTEIKATLKATREKFLKSRIWCVFQPHQYQRTYYLFKDFVRAFREAPIDKIIITDIFDVAGREKKNIKKKVSSKKLVKSIKKGNIVYLAKEKLLGFIKSNIKEIDVLIIMGAGNIYQLVSKLDKKGK